jgi:hypothetical protein
MKSLVVILIVGVVIVAAVAAFKVTGDSNKPQVALEHIHDDFGTDVDTTPEWEKPLPPGARELKKSDPTPKFTVVTRRRDVGKQARLEFEITEEHGYLVDGIRVFFWYREEDPETGEWKRDERRIEHFIKDRLNFNDTLVTSTTPREIEFRHIGVPVSETTSDNWEAEVVHFFRAAVRDQE